MSIATRSRQLLTWRWLSWQSNRHASNLYKRMKTEEKREEEIVEYSSSRGDKRVRRTYVWGNTTTGALGTKSFLEVRDVRSRVLIRNRPFQLKYFQELDLEVRHVAAGYGFSLFAARNSKRKDAVYGTGVNSDSQLGYLELGRKKGRVLDYVLEPSHILLPVTPEVKVRHLGCGRAHSIIVTNEGTFSLGNNSSGQCGRPVVEGEIYNGSQIITRMEVPDGIQQVVCGQDHTLFLTVDGDLYSCGLGANGQTGQGHYDVTTRVERMRGLEGRKVVHVSCMADTVLAVTDTGEVFGCGNSEYGQLLTATNELQANEMLALPLADVGHVTKVAAGGTMCAVLNDRGDVHVWGYGVLGLGPSVDQSASPLQLPRPLFGRNEFNPDSRVVDIQAGIGQFAAVTNHGEVYTWGTNSSGVLGLGLRSKQQYFPLKCNVPASVSRIELGVDHVIAHCRAVV